MNKNTFEFGPSIRLLENIWALIKKPENNFNWNASRNSKWHVAKGLLDLPQRNAVFVVVVVQTWNRRFLLKLVDFSIRQSFSCCGRLFTNLPKEHCFTEIRPLSTLDIRVYSMVIFTLLCFGFSGYINHLQHPKFVLYYVGERLTRWNTQKKKNQKKNTKNQVKPHDLQN